MSEFLRLTLLLVAAVNPAAAAVTMASHAGPAGSHGGWRPAVVCMAVAALCFLLAAVFAQRILDGLAIEPESFRIAAGGVMAMVGAQIIWRGRAASITGEGHGWQMGVSPLGIPVVAGPAGIVAAVSISADHGANQAIGAAGIALGIVAVALVARPGNGAIAVLDGVARLTGALLVAFAVAMVISGIKAV